VDNNFEYLIKLQDIDAKIKDITLFLEKTPSKLDEIDSKIEESFSVVQSHKEKLSQNQKKRRELDSEVEDIKTNIAKLQRQLNDVKTNKEYSYLLKEIEDAKTKVGDLEEEIISEMLASDDIESEIKTAELKAKKDKQSFSMRWNLRYRMIC